MSAWRDKEEFKARVLAWADKLDVKVRADRPADAQQVGILFDRWELELQRGVASLGPRSR